MPALLIRHHVADYPAWKAVFDEHETTRQANGSQGGRLFRDAADPQEVLLLLEWDDLERARLFVDSDDLQEAMTRAGVAGRARHLVPGGRGPLYPRDPRRRGCGNWSAAGFTMPPGSRQRRIEEDGRGHCSRRSCRMLLAGRRCSRRAALRAGAAGLAASTLVAAGLRTTRAQAATPAASPAEHGDFAGLVDIGGRKSVSGVPRRRQSHRRAGGRRPARPPATGATICSSPMPRGRW